MREFTVQVFDETITGTSTTWYTSATFNDLLGSADELIVHAVADGVSGTVPTLTVGVDHSCNGIDWINVGWTASTLTGQTLANDTTYYGFFPTFFPPLLTYARLRVFLGGTTPSCRLKVFACGRASAVAVPSSTVGSTP